MMKRAGLLCSIGLLLVGGFLLVTHVVGLETAVTPAAIVSPTGAVHKLLAAPGELPPEREDIRLWHDYGAFALYAVSDEALASLPPTLRARVETAATMDRILIDAHPFDTQRESLPLSPPFSQAASAGPALHLVQFVGPIKDEWLTAVAQTGSVPIHYIANNAYLVWAAADGRRQLDTFAREGHFVQYSAPFPPYFKLGKTVAARLARQDDADELLTVVVQMVQHDEQAAGEAAIQKLSVAQQTSWTPVLNFQNATFTVRTADVAAIAQRPDVYWVGEQATFALADEVQGQILAGNFDASQSGPSGPGYLAWLSNLGFSTDPDDYPIVDITDDGIGDGTADAGDVTLRQFGDGANPTRLAYVANCTAAANGGGVGGHGHINLSIAGGYDDRSGSPFEDDEDFQRGLGVNPFGRFAGTRVFAADVFDVSACGGTFNELIRQTYANGTRISSNSWACNTTECNSTYQDASQLYDVASRDADAALAGNQQLTFVFAAGNAGNAAETIGVPSNGKNVITVGASENDRPTWLDGCLVGASGADNAMDIISFSSRGPAAGNRTKPEVVAPGTHVQGTASPNAGYTGATVCDAYQPGDQTIFAASSGTSHATPAVAGVTSLYYYWLENEYGFAEPSPALLKAYLLAHTTYLTGTAANDTLPSNSQGFGMPNLSLAFDDASRYLLDQSAIFDNTGESWTWQSAAADPARPVRIVMAYTDQAGAIGTSPQVNDLSLQATIGDDTYWGNHFSGRWSTRGGTADAANNYEVISLPPGTAGTIEISVLAHNIAGDGVPQIGDATDQDFAFVCYNCALAPDFTLQASPLDQSICAPGSPGYTLDVGQIVGFDDPVTLGVSDAPAGTTAAFSTNPVVPAGSSQLTIGNTGAATAGSYKLTITGTAPTLTHSTTAWLHLYTSQPASFALTAPVDEETEVSIVPTFGWQAAAQAAAYQLEVATDDDFTNIVYQATVADTSHTLDGYLGTATTYYWRVRAQNDCGEQVSAVFRFTTQPPLPLLLVDDDNSEGLLSADVRSFYTSALEAEEIPYELWDVDTNGVEPDAATLALYKRVIWFSGEAFGFAGVFPPEAGPDAAGEAALASYLDGGGCFLISSQEYHFDWGLTPFMATYLGVDSVTDDVSQSSVSGAGEAFAELGPYSFSNPSLFVVEDVVVPDETAVVAFTGDTESVGVAKETAAYRSVFLGFPLEGVVANGRVEILKTFFDWCGTDPTPPPPPPPEEDQFLFLPLLIRNDE